MNAFIRARFQFDDKDLANALAGPMSPLHKPHDNSQGPIALEMILGIKNHGSSHLLVTTDQAMQLSRQRDIKLINHRANLSPLDFESLSPIYFHSVEALLKKLTSLRPKKSNKNATKDADQDTSQANHIYKLYNIDTQRAAFEHGRLIYRILNGLVDPAKYGVDNLSWTQDLRICSFVFNVRPIDDRKRAERLQNPLVLDIGFCEADLPNLEPNHSTAKHILDQRNAILGGNRKPFEYGVTQKILGQDAFEEAIRELFQDVRVRSSKTMILLVYNREQTLNYLRNINVDTSAWSFDLKELLQSSRARSSRAYSRDHPESRYHDRSRSPPRSHDPRLPQRSPSAAFQSNRGERYAEPSPAGPSGATYSNLYPPVCLVDVEQLYFKLMHNAQIKSVANIARQFGVIDQDGMCAGNEASYTIKIWKDMIAHELAIDEQGASRLGGLSLSDEQQNTAANAGPSSAPAFAPIDSDDEQDPNDIPAAQPTGNTGKQAQQMSFEDGESDYGDDDESDSD
ncbi:hypothetical protein JR316_0012326 [Psilocybe cubensis]|uniref:Uncharacterized protein n=2 Tax=Psilocybe cubensis TaxID=181762 RepID=A0A8H8CGS0_PSICU|nr:hypothetical protein JR316_0012326 [Psilocybe cubensis]KAH9475215.1 hypothetical protein JR316_0012326 [Psilocybe cubensis]